MRRYYALPLRRHVYLSPPTLSPVSLLLRCCCRYEARYARRYFRYRAIMIWLPLLRSPCRYYASTPPFCCRHRQLLPMMPRAEGVATRFADGC